VGKKEKRKGKASIHLSPTRIPGKGDRDGKGGVHGMRKEKRKITALSFLSLGSWAKKSRRGGGGLFSK